MLAKGTEELNRGCSCVASSAAAVPGMMGSAEVAALASPRLKAEWGRGRKPSIWRWASSMSSRQ